jgi:hypothetical protein
VEEEIDLKLVDLHINRKTSAGWRYEKNIYREYNWLGFRVEDEIFYMHRFKHFNVFEKDEIDFNDPNYHEDKYTIAECDFRIYHS